MPDLCFCWLCLDISWSLSRSARNCAVRCPVGPGHTFLDACIAHVNVLFVWLCMWCPILKVPIDVVNWRIGCLEDGVNFISLLALYIKIFELLHNWIILVKYTNYIYVFVYNIRNVYIYNILWYWLCHLAHLRPLFYNVYTFCSRHGRPIYVPFGTGWLYEQLTR